MPPRIGPSGWLLAMLLVVAAPPPAARANSPSEQFFSDCPPAHRVMIHRDNSALDLHAIAYTTSNLMELEVVRLADWIIDLPFPSVELRPIERSISGVRVQFDRVASTVPMQRLGEFVDALQLPELSLGDVASTYTGSTGEAGLGSGTVVRVIKLIDWTQHITGDLNWMAGRPVGRRDGLVRWRAPGDAVDELQRLVIRGFHGVSVLIARSIDGGVRGIEWTLEAAANAPRGTRHNLTTVVLRMPVAVYRAHELWVLDHRRRVYAGPPEELIGLTHGTIFHPKRAWRHPTAWWDLGRFPQEPPVVIVITDASTFAKAPAAWRSYVIPADWMFSRPDAVEPPAAPSSPPPTDPLN